MYSETETSVTHLPDGRRVQAVRRHYFIAEGGTWKRIGPPTEWEFDVDGSPVSRDTAEAALRLT